MQNGGHCAPEPRAVIYSGQAKTLWRGLSLRIGGRLTICTLQTRTVAKRLLNSVQVKKSELLMSCVWEYPLRSILPLEVETQKFEYWSWLGIAIVLVFDYTPAFSPPAIVKADNAATPSSSVP